VQLLEFGRLAIMLEGEERRPPIAKSYELLAYLLTRPHHRAERDELLDALFDARVDDSTRSYLRQAVHRLRSVLPPDGVISERAAVGLSDDLAVVSESVELERGLAQAARLRGADRLAATLAALETVDQGPYLPGIDSRWVEERRQQLRELATDARYEAAGLAFSEGRLQHAERLTETVLEAEPFHEPAWRLAMRLACARGDNHDVLRSYQRCAQILAEVGAEPSATTRQLVDQLRR
jgi:DNA-binding SARP family transcriptional activator